jgi:hypothetical protein
MMAVGETFEINKKGITRWFHKMRLSIFRSSSASKRTHFSFILYTPGDALTVRNVL